jgi:hypothetical protein
LAALLSQREPLLAKLEQCDAAIRAATEPQAELDVLRTRRRELLADQFLGRPVVDIVDLDAEIESAELSANALRIKAEGAQAAHERLNAQLVALDDQIRTERARTADLQRAVIREERAVALAVLADTIASARRAAARYHGLGLAEDQIGQSLGWPPVAAGVHPVVVVEPLINCPDDAAALKPRPHNREASEAVSGILAELRVE